MDRIAGELERARAHRAASSEGRARVCARRAAGLAARGFLERQDPLPVSRVTGTKPIISPYRALQLLVDHPGLSPDAKRRLSYLTMVVNTEFNLPQGIDLIAEAETLIGILHG